MPKKVDFSKTSKNAFLSYFDEQYLFKIIDLVQRQKSDLRKKTGKVDFLAPQILRNLEKSTFLRNNFFWVAMGCFDPQTGLAIKKDPRTSYCEQKKIFFWGTFQPSQVRVV